MTEADAQCEEFEGEDLRLLRVLGGVNSDAWRMYRDWVSSLGEVYPQVRAVYDPTVELLELCPPKAFACMFDIHTEANSIICHVASLSIADCELDARPAITGPLLETVIPINVRDAQVAVDVLPKLICDPGVSYSRIDSLCDGTYICHLMTIWRGATITVPLFRSRS